MKNSVFLERAAKILRAELSQVGITMFQVQIHAQSVFVMEESQSGAKLSYVLLPRWFLTFPFLKNIYETSNFLFSCRIANPSELVVLVVNLFAWITQME